MRKFTIFLALMLFIGLQVAHAQRTISGKVTGYDDGLGIPGVTVLVKGTTIGTITDVDGNYTLTVPKDKEILQISIRIYLILIIIILIFKVKDHIIRLMIQHTAG